MRLKKQFSMIFSFVFLFSQTGWGRIGDGSVNAIKTFCSDGDGTCNGIYGTSDGKSRLIYENGNLVGSESCFQTGVNGSCTKFLPNSAPESANSTSIGGATPSASALGAASPITASSAPSSKPASSDDKGVKLIGVRQTTNYFFSESKTEYAEKCQANRVMIETDSCNEAKAQTGSVGIGVGASNNGDQLNTLGSGASGSVDAARTECVAESQAAKTECVSVKSTITRETNECKGQAKEQAEQTIAKIDSEKQAPCSDTTGVGRPQCLKLNKEILTEKGNFSNNIKSCEGEGKKYTMAVKEEESKIDMKKLAMIAAGAAAIALLAKMMDNGKKAKEDTASTATTPTTTTSSTTVAQDATCASGDMNCLCKAGRQYRPVACDRSCPMQNGRMNASCLSGKYGPDWQNKSIDINNQVVARNTSGSGGDSSTPADPLSTGAGGMAVYSGSGSSGSSATAGRLNSDTSNREIGGGTANSKTTSSGTGTTDSLSSGGVSLASYSSSEFGGNSRLDQNSQYASGLPQNRKPANAERAQLASKGDNMFSNISARYKKYSLSMMD